VAVINHGPAPVDLTSLDIDLQRAGETLDSRRITLADLAKIADHGKKLQASGAMTLFAFQFCGKALIGAGGKLSGPRLEPEQATLLTYQTFAFNGVRDALRVTVHARDAMREVAESATIPIRSDVSKTVFHFPLKGVWFIGNGPTPHTAHRWALPEEFAFDIARIGEGDLTHRGAGDRFSDYYAYGAEVMAAADGQVIAAVNNIPEDATKLQRAGESDEAYAARLMQMQAALLTQSAEAATGDYVVIAHAGGEYSLYAHLQPSSVTLKAGDLVKAGQVIGRLGGSGNSTEPHLHFQVCDGPHPLDCAGIPINFIGVRPLGEPPRPIQVGDMVIAD
jgi:murein DD-endopeptidase MepM/ murein hydrolase activator NlpD